METMRELRERKRQEKFVGRQKEITLFTSLLQEETPIYGVLVLWGIGGIGKSTLLYRMREEAIKLDAKVATADLHETRDAIELLVTWRSHFETEFQEFEQTLAKFQGIQSKVKAAIGSVSKGVIRAVGQASPFGVPLGAFAVETLGEERIKFWLNSVLTKPEVDFYLSGEERLTTSFVTDLNKLAQYKRLVLMLDTYEVASQEIDGWIRSFLESGLSSRVLIAIAGRDKLENMNSKWFDWMPIIFEIEVKQFSDSEATEYLQLFGIRDDQVITKIRAFTGDLPWALELTAECLIERPQSPIQVAETAEFRVIEQKVVSRFLRQLSEEKALQQLVEACAVLRHFNEDILEYILRDKVTQSLKSLRHYSFFKIRADGEYMLNDTVREFIEAELKSRAPDRWRNIQSRVANYYSELLSQASRYGLKWQDYMLEWLYHVVVNDEARAVQAFASHCPELLDAHLIEYCSSMITLLERRVKAPENRVWLTYYGGQIRFNEGKWPQAKEAMQQIIDLDLSPVCLKLGAYSTLCDILHRQGEVAQCLQEALNGLWLAEKANLPEFSALLAARAGEMYGTQARLPESKTCCSISEQSLAKVTEPYLAAPVHILLADVYIFRGDWTSGERNLKMALQHWEAANHTFGTARTKVSLGWLYSMTGKWEQGLRICQEAHEFFDNHQDTYHIGLNALNTAEIYRLQGRDQLAMEYNQKAITLLAQVGSKLYEGIATYQLGCAYLDRLQVDEAITTLEHALKLKEEAGREVYYIGLVLLQLGLAHKRVNHPEQAARYLTRAEATLATAQNQYGFALLHLENCRQALVTGDYDAFLSSLPIADKIASEWDYTDLLAMIHEVKGEYKLHLYMSQIKDQVDTHVLPDILETFASSLKLAIFYNRYLLDRTMQAIREAILRCTYIMCSPRSGLWLLDGLADFWQSARVETGSLLTEFEAYNRSLEIGDGASQVSLLEQIEAIRSNLRKGYSHVS